MRNLFLSLLLLCLSWQNAAAQLQSSAAPLTRQRIRTTRTGMYVLGSWGAANVIGGIAGYRTAPSETGRRFYEMNAIWGAVNLGIAGLGYLGCRREAKISYSFSEAFSRQDATTRLFLLNAGLDGLYIGTGLYLAGHARHTSGNPAIWRGYGRSVMLQGAGLLLFDGIMYSIHEHQGKRWYKLLEGLSFWGNGAGLRYTI